MRFLNSRTVRIQWERNEALSKRCLFVCQRVCCFVIVGVREFVCMDVSVRVLVNLLMCVSVRMCL